MLWLLRIPLCYELTAPRPRQDNHQERPVAWSFTTLGAPPDPGTCIHHVTRVLGSSPKSPAAAKGRGRSLSIFLWLLAPRTFKIVLGQSWHTLVRWNTAQLHKLLHSGFQNYSNIRHTSRRSLAKFHIEIFAYCQSLKPTSQNYLCRSLILKYKRN